MSKLLPSRPRLGTQRKTFAIVAGEYNREFVDGLVDHAERELNEISHAFQIQKYSVPGAFEIPLVVQELAGDKGIDAIIALGVIIEGETAHASLIATSVTHSLQQIALAYRIPVVHEVLLVKTAEQAKKRSLEETLNRGTEAARVAAKMVQVMSDLRASLR